MNLKARIVALAGGISARWAALGAFLVAMLVGSAPAMAATPTYAIDGITTSLTNDLTVDVPIILGLVGGLLALVLAVRMIRKFVRA